LIEEPLRFLKTEHMKRCLRIIPDRVKKLADIFRAHAQGIRAARDLIIIKRNKRIQNSIYVTMRHYRLGVHTAYASPLLFCVQCHSMTFPAFTASRYPAVTKSSMVSRTSDGIESGRFAEPGAERIDSAVFGQMVDGTMTVGFDQVFGKKPVGKPHPEVTPYPGLVLPDNHAPAVPILLVFQR